MIPNNRFLTTAIILDTHTGQMGRSITAEAATPETHSPDQYHFYCPHCLEGGHYNRVVRITEVHDKTRHTPPKFDLYAKLNSTHRCQHPVRFRDIDILAKRYDAQRGEDHTYIFSFNMAGISAPGIQGIDSVSRLGKIMYAVMFDPALPDRQFFMVSHQHVSLRRLFEQKANAVPSCGQSFHKAAIMTPNPLPRYRYENFTQNEISGVSNYHAVDAEGKKINFRHVLSFRDTETFKEVKAIVERRGTSQSAPVMVFAKAVLSYQSKHRDYPVMRFLIDTPGQVMPWDHPRSFREALDRQVVRPEALNVRRAIVCV
jgi:hypothetical protein